MVNYTRQSLHYHIVWGGGGRRPKYLYSCQCDKMSFIQNAQADLSELSPHHI